MKRGQLLVLFSDVLYNKNGDCMNVYLIASESFRLIDEEIAKICKNSHNIIKYDLANSLLQDIIEEALYMSLLTEQKYIVVKNANFFSSEKIKESDNELLIKYLENPNKQTTIIFTTQNKLDERKKITKLVKEKYKVIDIPKLNPYDLNKKVRTILNKEGFKIDYESVNYLLRNCLNNYDLIFNELEKIKLYYVDQKDIKFNDLKNLISNNIEDNIFKLINAIIEKNNNDMFKIFNDLKLLKEEPISFIVLLSREYRNMYLIKENKTNENDLCKILNIAKWQYEKLKKCSYDYSILELKNKLKELYNLDLKIKKGKIDKYLGFELFMLNI